MESAKVVDQVRLVLVLRERRYHRERRDVHEGVRRQIHESSGDAVETERHHADECVPHVGDPGVGQHALDITLRDRYEVAQNLRGDCDGREQRHPAGCDRLGGDRRHRPRQGNQHHSFGDDREEGRHGSRRTLVHVRGPRVEGDQRQLEGEPREQEGETGQQQRVARQRARTDDLRDGPQRERAGRSIQQRDPEQQQR